MHTLQRRLRRSAGLAVVAVMALPLAAQAADYRVQLSESVNSGLRRCASDAAPASRSRQRRRRRARPDRPRALLGRHASSLRLRLEPLHGRLDRARSSARSRASSPGQVPARCACSATARTRTGAYVRAGVDVPSATASIIGNDNLDRDDPPHDVGRAHHVRARLARRRRQARRQGRQLDAAARSRSRCAARSSTPAPSHGITQNPSRPDRDDQLRRGPGLCPAGLHHAAARQRDEQRHRAPAEDRHARRAGERALRLPLLDRRHRSLPATPSASSRSRRTASCRRAARRW